MNALRKMLDKLDVPPVATLLQAAGVDEQAMVVRVLAACAERKLTLEVIESDVLNDEQVMTLLAILAREVGAELDLVARHVAADRIDKAG